MKHIWKTRWML